MGAFRDTKLLFIETLGYEKPWTYDQWLSISDDFKSAALYVQFYPQIYTAWEKTKSFYTPEEDGVSTVMQYLEKNVSRLVENEKKFSPAYIYRVAYNCLYCICHDIKRDRIRWETEVSNIVSYGEGGDMLDLFDTIVDDSDDHLSKLDRLKFWQVVESLGPEAEKVVNHILNGTKLGKVRPGEKGYKQDPLRDIEVSLKQMGVIVEDMKVALAAFRDIYY